MFLFFCSFCRIVPNSAELCRIPPNCAELWFSDSWFFRSVFSGCFFVFFLCFFAHSTCTDFFREKMLFFFNFFLCFLYVLYQFFLYYFAWFCRFLINSPCEFCFTGVFCYFLLFCRYFYECKKNTFLCIFATSQIYIKSVKLYTFYYLFCRFLLDQLGVFLMLRYPS